MWDYITGKNNQYMRVDVVSDNYKSPHLLKNGVRVDRDSVTTVIFELESILPSNFKTDFFFCSDNKARLYRMMAGYFATLARDSATGTQYFITQGSSEVSGALPDSTHLEADFRLVGHMLYAARNGCSRTIVRGNDTDYICIILLAYLPTLLQCNSSYKLLFDCGTGASRFMFNINHLGDCIELECCQGLLFVYSLSNCDFTPSFFGVGKLKFFDLYI